MTRPVRYSTRQRTAVLDALKTHVGEYMSADDVGEVIRQSGVTIGRTTVYRTLEVLTQEGVVRRFVSDKKTPASYEYLQNPNAAEYHVQCRSCGKLFHLRCSEIERMATALSGHLLEDHGIALDLQSSVIQGVCRECQAKNTDVDGGAVENSKAPAADRCSSAKLGEPAASS